jgi:hypothetical protein
MTLSNNQKSAVRWLALKPGFRIDRSVVIEETRMSAAEFDHLAEYLASRDCIVIHRDRSNVTWGQIEAAPAIQEFALQLDKPPARDYWAEFTAGFRSYRISVPILLAVGIIGLLSACAGIWALLGG